MSRTARATLVAALLVGNLSVAKERAPDLRPWSVAVEVRWGKNPGPEAFRADVERSLAAALGRGCVAAVVSGTGVVAGASTDLVVVTTLHDFVEEISFDDTLAIAATPGEPSKELRRVATVEVNTDAGLVTREGSHEVAAKSFHAEVVYRPMYLGEDPQASARARVVERVVHELTRMLCKSGGKLARKVQEAFEAEGVPEPATR